MVIIGRPINGITVNGLEYVLDNEGNLMKFPDETAAKGFLLEHGYPSEELEKILDDGGIVFEED